MLNKELKLSQFSPGGSEEFELEKDHEFMTDLANELNEDVETDDPDFIAATLSAQINILRKTDPSYKDYLLIKGNIFGPYQAPCRRCLIPSNETLDAEFRAVFIPRYYEKEEDFKELDSLLIENEEYDLYYHDKGLLNFEEFLHEQVFLKVNPFPLHDSECRGLCSKCGANLNRNPCQHNSPVVQVDEESDDSES